MPLMASAASLYTVSLLNNFSFRFLAFNVTYVANVVLHREVTRDSNCNMLHEMWSDAVTYSTDHALDFYLFSALLNPFKVYLLKKTL